MAAHPTPSRDQGTRLLGLHESAHFPTGTAHVAEARRFVRSVLTDCAADDLAADFALMTSELVTNAIEHGTGDTVEVTVSCDGKVVSLSVTSVGNADDVGPWSQWRVAEPGAITGRGLGIVKALAHRIHVRRRGEQIRIVVERDLAAT